MFFNNSNNNNVKDEKDEDDFNDDDEWDPQDFEDWLAFKYGDPSIIEARLAQLQIEAEEDEEDRIEDGQYEDADDSTTAD